MDTTPGRIVYALRVVVVVLAVEIGEPAFSFGLGYK